MKFQVRIRDTMSDRPASEMFENRKEAEKKLSEVQEEIKNTWEDPDISTAYIRTFAMM